MNETDDILNLNKTTAFKADRIYSELLIDYPNTDLQQNFWQNEKLPLTVRNFLLVYHWIAFEEYESFHITLSLVYTDKMLDSLQNDLQMTDLAHRLKALKIKVDDIVTQTSQKELQVYLDKMNAFRNSNFFVENEQVYQNQKPFIFDKLIDYVAIHHKDFP